MVTVQYNGQERTIGGRVWYAGETRRATEKQLAAWQVEHGDVFVVVGGEPVQTEGDATDDDAKGASRKKAAK